MKRLWIADIHANLPAFEATLADAGQWDEVVFLGDIVGYGPHPSACVDLLRQLDAKLVVGNHDVSVLAVGDSAVRCSGFVNWDEWTYDQLDESQLSCMAAMPSELNVDFCGFKAVARHHIPGAPYLHPAMPDSVLVEYIRAVENAVTICGHSHRHIDRTVNGRRYICLPPVGQPRNGDPRAGYAIEENGTLSFHFTEYDIERTVADVYKIGLPDDFRQRWIRFVRTGRDVEWSRDYQPE